jgi:methionyl-tRNA formyltransferase
MQMEAGLDTGPMLHVVRTPVDRKTTGDLTGELAEMGAQAMVDVLADLAAFPPQPQDDARATYAPKIDKAEARIDWTDDAEAIERQVRGLAPFPGAWFEWPNDDNAERVKLLLAEIIAIPREGGDLVPTRSEAEDSARLRGSSLGGEPGEVLDADMTIACGSGAIRPVRLQRAGKPAMSREEVLRGRPVEPGMRLG